MNKPSGTARGGSAHRDPAGKVRAPGGTRFVQRFHALNLWKRGSERAPHKPLLVLLALGAAQRGEPRLLRYHDIDTKLSSLLEEFGPPRARQHPEYPFWRLRNDGIWEVEGPSRFAVRESSADARKSELLRHDARGGFLPEVDSRLRADPRLLGEVARSLLEAHFPPSMHDDILDEVGLTLGTEPARRSPRDPDFRRRILDAYDYMCAVCHTAIRLLDRTIGLEAAHIKWHEARGPDTNDNGLALCSFHHKLFDRGAFTLTGQHVIAISELASGNRGFQSWLLKFHGASARAPKRREDLPHRDYLRWHRKEVFKGRERQGRAR